jgi:2-succinyl-5-enolpyruvyl-6-hydroxy-3-cyclohexene-1-carboxylate synthase
LPAAIEACEDDQPLLLISADRPPELLECGANQATTQDRLFEAHARAHFPLPADASEAHARDLGRRAAAAALWPRPGPVHVDVAFREPLVAAQPEACGTWTPGSGRLTLPARVTPDLAAVAAVAARIGGRRGAILAGRLAPGDPAIAAVAGLARVLDCPVIADALSGLRSGDNGKARVLCAADAFLRNPDAPVPDWLVRVGRPPVSRHLEQWAAQCPDTTLLAPHTAWPDPLRSATRVIIGDPAASLAGLAAAAERAGLKAAPWRVLDELEQAAHDARAAGELPVEARLVEAIAAVVPPDAPVFVSNSLVVRDFDSFLGRRSAPLALYGNRGVSGIDGNLSTAAGIAAASGKPTVAVLGDLALFHDLNALALCRRHLLTLVVINNGGGAIFGQLPQAGLPEFDRLWLTPPELDLGRAAALFGLDHVRIEPVDDPAAALETAMKSGKSVLLELVVDRNASHAARRQWWEQCRGNAGQKTA